MAMEARAQYKRWIAALAVFLIWVAALGAMAVGSGRRPGQHPRVPASR
jgi:hypothetical protein